MTEPVLREPEQIRQDCAASWPRLRRAAWRQRRLLSRRTTVIIYGRGYQRTFGIGAMFPTGIPLLSISFDRFDLFRFGGMGGEEFMTRILLLGFWLSSILVGVVCMGVRRIVEKRQPSQMQ